MKGLFLLRFLFFQSIPHLYHQIPLERSKPIKIEFQGFVYDASPALYSGLELGFFFLKKSDLFCIFVQFSIDLV